MSPSLDALNHDILIYIFTALAIPEILLLRRVSRRLYLVSEQHAVWNTACTNEILRNGIPFLKRPLTSFSAKDLERETLRAYELGLNWRSPTTTLHHVISTPIEFGAIESIRFLSRHGRNWIITTSIRIWWTLCIRDCDSLQVVAQWSPGKALFNGMAVNSDDHSDAAIAISVHWIGRTTVELLSISDDSTGGITIHSRRILDTSSKPVALDGDIIALCDHDSETMILNWKTQEQALLRSPDTWQVMRLIHTLLVIDKPLHVAFTRGSIFVVRARSICIFDEPRMALPGDSPSVVLPRIFKSFGWLDGVALALGSSAPFCPVSSSQSPLSLLVRDKGGDPWRPTELFQFMTLNADFNRTPDHTSQDISSTSHEPQSLSFPFSRISDLSSNYRGPLRCSDMVLGSYGTAVWVQPSDWAAGGLIAGENFVEQVATSTSRESLVVALFPGLLNQGSPEAHIKVVLESDGSGWSCLDYDEARGLIALGSGSGEVTVFRL
ncbi:hypothetical protein L210DRAFT_3398248 [Boletus edulis BED1]|uniref:F-box domain-containing protein n=1 Tax=Boletus edulis BED1 TaxID=1328754 RepID=A0AAD4GG12_BOLED|nr:hypothetical protein L210DRAFT_3398248 [Boletus edulis BED1]